MRLHRTGILVVWAGVLWGGPALAEAPLASPTLRNATRSGWLRFRVVSGCITIEGSRLGNIRSNSARNSGSEKLSIRVTNGKPAMTYECSTPQEQFSVEVTSDDGIRIRRSGKQGTAIVAVQFTQASNEPASLALGPDGQEEIYRGATLWHLFIAQPERCRQHLIPLLESLRPDWKLAETAAAIEGELLRAAAAGELPDRQRWDALVKQLADDQFAKREAADRALRSAGQAVLGYLRQLDFSRLAAEQQFRIRRIMVSLSERSAEDTPGDFAPRLLGDPTIWLALLSRREESTRRLAAGRLAAVLGKPVAFDPAADATTRKRQIERLQAQVQGNRPGAKY